MQGGIINDWTISEEVFALRKMNQNVKIIAVSGLMQNATIKEYENVVFLSKPYPSPPVLFVSLRSILAITSLCSCK